MKHTNASVQTRLQCRLIIFANSAEVITDPLDRNTVEDLTNSKIEAHKACTPENVCAKVARSYLESDHCSVATPQ